MFSFWGVLSLIIRVLFEQQWSFFNYHFHHWNSYKTGCNVCANILIHRRALYWSSIEYCYHFIIICKAFKNVWNKTPNHTFSHLFKKKFAFEKKKKKSKMTNTWLETKITDSLFLTGWHHQYLHWIIDFHPHSVIKFDKRQMQYNTIT